MRRSGKGVGFLHIKKTQKAFKREEEVQVKKKKRILTVEGKRDKSQDFLFFVGSRVERKEGPKKAYVK